MDSIINFAACREMIHPVEKAKFGACSRLWPLSTGIFSEKNISSFIMPGSLSVLNQIRDRLLNALVTADAKKSFVPANKSPETSPCRAS